MSELASKGRLAPGTSQLPVSAYFDERVFELEKARLCEAGPGYVGHELMVPESGRYRSLECLDHAYLLMRAGEDERPDAVRLMFTICRHRQAVMLHGSGTAEHLVCLVPRWTYDRQGACSARRISPKTHVSICAIRRWKTGADCFFASYVGPGPTWPTWPTWTWRASSIFRLHTLSWQFGSAYPVQKLGLAPLTHVGHDETGRPAGRPVDVCYPGCAEARRV